MPAIFTQNAIAQNPTIFSFKIGEGYKMLGAPRIPSPPVGVPSVCEPPVPCEEGSWHRLIPPGNEHTYIRVQWNPTMKYWAPPLESAARRIAFTSAYLAACGWVYGEAE